MMTVLDGDLRLAVDMSAGMNFALTLVASAMPMTLSIPHTPESYQRQPCRRFCQRRRNLCCYFGTRDKVGIASEWDVR
jgi:hypothetical protein